MSGVGEVIRRLKNGGEIEWGANERTWIRVEDLQEMVEWIEARMTLSPCGKCDPLPAGRLCDICLDCHSGPSWIAPTPPPPADALEEWVRDDMTDTERHEAYWSAPSAIAATAKGAPDAPRDDGDAADWLKPVRDLIFAARTSGGVAGRDDLLVSACERAEAFMIERSHHTAPSDEAFEAAMAELRFVSMELRSMISEDDGGIYPHPDDVNEHQERAIAYFARASATAGGAKAASDDELREAAGALLAQADSNGGFVNSGAWEALRRAMAGKGGGEAVNSDEIAILLDDLAEAISCEAATRHGGGTRPVINGDQALTVIIMALRKLAEGVAER